MLRELDMNEMEMVSGGGGNPEEDEVVSNGVRYTADDGGTVGPPLPGGGGAGNVTRFYSTVTGQSYHTSDARAIAEGLARELEEQFGNPTQPNPGPNPQDALNAYQGASGIPGVETGQHISNGVGVDYNSGNPRLTYTTDF